MGKEGGGCGVVGTTFLIGCSFLRNLFILLRTMVLKMLVLMFCNTDTLMQPESKKEKVTKMNNYS